MKKIEKTIFKALSSAALNTAKAQIIFPCTFFLHQPDLNDNLKKKILEKRRDG